MRKIAVYAAFLLLAALTLALAAGCAKTGTRAPLPSFPDESTSESVVPFQPDTPSEPTPVVTPDPTPVSTPSLPDPTPTPTTPLGSETPDIPSEQTPTPAPVFEPITGVFMSDTGTSLNLEAEYTVNRSDDGTYTVSVTVYLDCFSLFCSKRTNCNYLTIDGTEFVYSTDALAFDDGTGRHRTALYSNEVTYTEEQLPDGIYISASWYFHGRYSKVEIDRIVAEGRISLNG